MIVKAKPPEAPKPESKTEEKTEEKAADKPVASNTAKKAPKKEISAEEKARIDAERRARFGRAGQEYRHPQAAGSKGRWIGLDRGCAWKRRRGSGPRKGIPRRGRPDGRDQ